MILTLMEVIKYINLKYRMHAETTYSRFYSSCHLFVRPNLNPNSI